jgi:hypothetical protein
MATTIKVNGQTYSVSDIPKAREIKAIAAQIRVLLAVKGEAVERAVLAINERQTQDEQAVSCTIYKNHKGWNKPDAQRKDGSVGFGPACAASIKTYGHLTAPQLNAARRMMRKYAVQLARVAVEKARSEAVVTA